MSSAKVQSLNEIMEVMCKKCFKRSIKLKIGIIHAKLDDCKNLINNQKKSNPNEL